MRHLASTAFLFVPICLLCTAAFATEAPPEMAPATVAAASQTWSTFMPLHAIYPAVLIANATRSISSEKTPHRLGEPFGAVGVRVHVDEPNTKISISIKVDELAEQTQLSYTATEPGDWEILPRVQWHYDKLRAVTQPSPVNVTVALAVNGKPLGRKTGRVTVRSVNDVPLSVKTKAGTEDLSWMFAAFVNEEHPWIDGLLRDALNTHIVKSFVGYHRDEATVHKQVEAIYVALHRRGVVYSSITTTSAANGAVHLQHVRFVSDSVRNAQANCIDGTVLMASILRKIGIEPLILLGPGHAMVAYYNGPNRSNGITVVETTMIGTHSFGDAVKAGAKRFQQWQRSGSPQFHSIDIRRARDAGVAPIAR